jgi:hypothetical protein
MSESRIDRSPSSGPVRSRRTPPARIVDDARASLRAADMYVRVLIDRIDLSCTSDLAGLGEVSADDLARLAAASDAFVREADRTLAHLHPDVARNARIVADLARESVDRGDEPEP